PEGGYRQGVDQGPRGLLAWSQVARLPAICAHCAAPSEKTTTAVLGLEGGSQLRLSLPICGSCWRRKVRRIVVAVVTMTLAAVGSANLASSLYPPGNMRGLIIFGVVSAVGLVLWLAYRLWPMPPPIAEHRGGAAGAELYLRFESSAFEERVRADNGL
ncbi:MAG: hypothetical protein KC731_08035, partial [Myxococcales bacterium]|nr:hypothetical protein [Myxococcales bacterium]